MKIGLVGATNVGKSTLFNRLIGQYRAIVTDIAGTTTDILQHNADLTGLGRVTFLDSPGLHDFAQEWPYIQYIVDQSDVILFVVDDSTGFSGKEDRIFSYITEQGKKAKTVLVVNKLDVQWKDAEYDVALSDYYQRGFGDVVGVSAKKEKNLQTIMSLLQKYQQILPTSKEEKAVVRTDQKSIAIVGKPNAGKSTLLNTLVGEVLAKVEDKAGTTRDYVSGEFTYGDETYHIFDTAGIKRKGHMKGIEKIAYTKTKQMLSYVRPTVLFVIDAIAGITHRDMTLMKEIDHLALPMIVCVNKVDLLNKKETKLALQKVQANLDFARYYPILPLVAQTGQGLSDIMQMVNAIWEESGKRVDTGALNKALNDDYLQRPPRFPRNKICKIMYATQVDVHAPTFVLFVNHVDRANFAFRRWIDNTIRRHFGFVGVPLVFRFKQREKKKIEE